MQEKQPYTSGSLRDGILSKDRRVLAQAITMSESLKPEDRKIVRDLLGQLMPKTGHSFRLGVCGAAGAGKSTFIEYLGLALLKKGFKVAVLAIDPSSPVTGGAILGDKSRMIQLSREHSAFVRPSPSLSHGGGIGQRTREAIHLCEAAGFDLIVVETEGIGQGDVDIAGIVDDVVLLIPPSAGDELQGIKRGILEIADHLYVTKADGLTLDVARATELEYKSALSLRDDAPTVRAISSLNPQDIDHVAADLMAFDQKVTASGQKASRRVTQNKQWFREELEAGLKVMVERMIKDSPFCDEMGGGESPPQAAWTCLEKIYEHVLKKG